MKLIVTKTSGAVIKDREPKRNELIFDAKKSKDNDAFGLVFDIIETKENYIVLNIKDKLLSGYKQYVFTNQSITMQDLLDGVIKKFTFELIED